MIKTLWHRMTKARRALQKRRLETILTTLGMSRSQAKQAAWLFFN